MRLIAATERTGRGPNPPLAHAIRRGMAEAVAHGILGLVPSSDVEQQLVPVLSRAENPAGPTFRVRTVAFT